MIKRIFYIVFLFFLTAANVLAQNGNLSQIPILPLSEIKEGMRGTAKTVFRGSEPEEFNVEILGVLPGAIGPKQDLIVARISGAQVEKTAVFAGMSGSPVFVDGKLIGAIAYSFPFSKEPICGITPVEQMINIFGKETAKKPARVSSFYLSEIFSPSWEIKPKKETTLKPQAFQPIATPLAFSGFSPQTIDVFSSKLSEFGFLPIASVGGSTDNFGMKAFNEKTLRPGASVGMSLVRGDFAITAFGTVTFRDGEKVYAFGHPFLNLGNTSFPMTESRVVAVVPSVLNSFKLAVSDATVGSMTEDRNTGVLGKLGQPPKMIPVNVELWTSRQKPESFYFEVVEDEFLTPLLLNITAYNVITVKERSLGNATVDVSGTIEIKDHKPVVINRKFTGILATQLAASAIAASTNIILRSGFEQAKISRINLRITFSEGEKSATLEKIVAEKTEVKSGETLEIQAFIRTSEEKLVVRRFRLKIPDNLPEGNLQVLVGDADSIQKILPDALFTPQSLAELIEKMNEARKNDRLYAFLLQQGYGAVIGAKELPNLPPSFIATLNDDRASGNFTPTALSIIEEQESEAIDYAITGQKILNLRVKD